MADPAARVMLPTTHRASTDVDGGWWQRTTNLVAELPGLAEAVTHQVGAVTALGYHRNAWDPGPSQLTTAEGQVVRLQSYLSDEPRTVVVLGADGRVLVLGVVPPGTDPATAQQLLQDTCRSEDPTTAVESGAEKAIDRSLTEVTDRLTARLTPPSGANHALIAQWVAEAANQFGDARIQGFVPILVEHIVRTRMTATTREAGRARG